MECNNSVTVSYEGISFNAYAIARKEQELWIETAGKQYFQNLSEEKRAEKLKEVYALCAEALRKDNAAPITEPIAEVVAELPATDNTKTIRQNHSRNKRGGKGGNVKNS